LTTVTGQFSEITEERKDADNWMATLLRVTSARNRKYLPYRMVNILGAKREAVLSRATA
jgi:hypothetical protein